MQVPILLARPPNFGVPQNHTKFLHTLTVILRNTEDEEYCPIVVIPVKTVININVFMLKTVTIFGPSTGRKLEQITPGILRNTPVTRNTVNLTPKTVTLQKSN